MYAQERTNEKLTPNQRRRRLSNRLAAGAVVTAVSAVGLHLVSEHPQAHAISHYAKQADTAQTNHDIDAYNSAEQNKQDALRTQMIERATQIGSGVATIGLVVLAGLARRPPEYHAHPEQSYYV